MSTFSEEKEPMSDEIEPYVMKVPDLTDVALWDIASRFDSTWTATEGSYSPATMILLIADVIFPFAYPNVQKSEKQEKKKELQERYLRYLNEQEEPYAAIPRHRFDLYSAHVARELNVQDFLVVATPTGSSKIRQIGLVYYIGQMKGTWQYVTKFDSSVISDERVPLIHRTFARLYFNLKENLIDYFKERSFLGTYQDAQQLSYRYSKEKLIEMCTTGEIIWDVVKVAAYFHAYRELEYEGKIMPDMDHSCEAIQQELTDERARNKIKLRSNKPHR